MKRNNLATWIERRRQQRASRSQRAGKGEGLHNWIAITISIVSFVVAGCSLYLQWTERSTPFEVERFVSHLTSYREVSASARELTRDLPNYIFVPTRQKREAHERLAKARDVFEANSMMWDAPIAQELEQAAHAIDLVSLGLQGGREINHGEGVISVVRDKVQDGASSDRQKLLNDTLNQMITCVRMMQVELDAQRDRTT